MFKRPQPSETEEDILRLQEEFLRNKDKLPPAATVVNAKIDLNDEKMDQSDLHMETSVSLQNQIDNTFEEIPSQISIGQVIEKSHDVNQKMVKISHPTHSGFPQATRRNLKVKEYKGSIFSQQIKKMKQSESKMEIENESPSSSNNVILKTENIVKEANNYSKNFTVEEKIPPRSYIVSGRDKDDIHKENVQVMQQMSEQEILEEREKLLATMDPAILAFLKSKRERHFAVRDEKMPTVSDKNKAAEDVNIEEIETTAEIIGHQKADSWLHFDTVETGKLAWMKSVNVPKIKKSELYEARFDFDGWLLPFSIPEINEQNRTLYHHGDEPGRPGYTLQELFQLSRSSVIQQKILALKTISNLLSLYQSGVYKDILELPIEQIFFVVRFCLDDNTPSVLNYCVKAMRNLIYYVIDEICIDNCLGFGLDVNVQPILPIDAKEVDDDRTVNDQQLAETNLVKCLVRTEILTRIRYIINVVKPPVETIVYCLEILIRLSRDSYYIAGRVFSCDNLMKSIINRFIPVVTSSCKNSNEFDIPLVQAIKLVRILSSRNSRFAADFVQKYRVIDSLMSYLSNEEFSMNTNGLKLQFESLHLWSVFVHYGLTIEHFKILQPILLRILDFHARNTSAINSTSYVIQSHVSSLLNLISNVAKKEYSAIIPYISLLIDPALIKWTAQFGSLTEYSCGKLQIVSSLMNCFANLYKFRFTNVNLPIEEIETAVQNMITSRGFDEVTRNLRFSSNLFCDEQPQKSSPNLRTLESVIFNATDHIVPIFQKNSCIPFLTALSEFIDSSECNKTRLVFLRNKNILNYLKLLQKTNKYKLTENWFTRIESTLILNILKAAVAVQKDIDTRIFYEIAVKCVSIFNSEQKQDVEFIMFNIIFSPRFYPSEVLMQNLDISGDRGFLKIALDNIDNVFETYSYTLGLKQDICDLSTNLCVDATTGNIFPIDWVYSPIVMLYSNLQDKNKFMSEEKKYFLVKNCLRWICTYETYFPSLANVINTTDRFCRIACVFLGSDDLFLDEEVQMLMKLCLKNILSNVEEEINFSKPIKGLNNFQDFYTQILEQYQGVSYGNILFGNFILLPLAQKQNKKYRKILWSEYAGILQIFNVTENECLYPINIFLEPAEDDETLLECYKNALSSGMIRKNSVLYKIATHHLKSFYQSKNKSS